MNRHQLPTSAADPDMSVRATEIRVPGRAQGHAMRNDREGRP